MRKFLIEKINERVAKLLAKRINNRAEYLYLFENHKSLDDEDIENIRKLVFVCLNAYLKKINFLKLLYVFLPGKIWISKDIENSIVLHLNYGFIFRSIWIIRFYRNNVVFIPFYGSDKILEYHDKKIQEKIKWIISQQ